MATTCKLSITPQLARKASTAAPRNLVGVRAPAARGLRMKLQASQANTADRNVVEVAKEMGFDMSEGFFGFTPFSELWVGRLAMAGFATGLAEELVTGQTILEQVGLADGSGYANPELFYTMLGLMLVPTGIATINTFVKVATGEMTVKQFKGYAKFFGLQSEEDAKMISTMNKLALMDELKGTVNDTSLTVDDAASCEWPNPNAAPSSPWPRLTSEQREAEMTFNYARDVEMDNGRWAMIGFALAILIEAGTGAGVIQQIIFYMQFSGLLQPQ